ncbi:MAG: metalloregulator ArsR/SmtB family transcription factor [Christensenellales bacterium]|jgi:ArsR family transcriptional regulator|nr:winged helix-turn-helix transcriptional regulator [Clostridiales bacterium]MEE1441225.1 metalloregulator ArsR/SmtB family transcription factor [Christensenellales bacterium]
MDCFKASIPILKVLCDETRLSILSMLSQADLNGCEITRAFCFSQPTISYHMKQLVDAQLVMSRKEGCTVIYSVNRDIWPHVRALLDVLCAAAKKKGEKADG